jgi:hypothetical protein
MTQYSGWTNWVWSEVNQRWEGQFVAGPTPGDSEFHMDYSHGTPHRVLNDPRRALTTSTPEQGILRKTHSEIIAHQNATIRGRDIYVPTTAEEAAKAAGLRKDQYGYYKMEGHQRLYVTGRDPLTGVRWHYDTGGQPLKGPEAAGRIWDDDQTWPVMPTGDLKGQWATKRDELARARDAYASARTDDWTERRNLLQRVRDLEDDLMLIGRAMGAEPVREAQGIVKGDNDVHFVGGVRTRLQFAVYDELNDLSFGDGLSGTLLGVHLVVMAVVEFENEGWKPGQLRTPDMVHVTWQVPTDWLSLDNVPIGGTDEFVTGKVLYLMRDFQTPTTGNTDTGAPVEWEVGVNVYPYDIVLGAPPENPHKEGDDGYFGGPMLPGNVGLPPGSDPTLAAFMEALCMPESNCEGHRPDGSLKVNSLGCFGKWQICPRQWPSWSHHILGANGDPDGWPKTDENIAAVAYGICAEVHNGTGSWRRTAVSWHHGHGWMKTHPLAGLPGPPGEVYGSLGLQNYVRRILTLANLPMD